MRAPASLKKLLRNYPEVKEDPEVACLDLDDGQKKMTHSFVTLQASLSSVVAWKVTLSKQRAPWARAVEELWGMHTNFRACAAQFVELAAVVRKSVIKLRKRDQLKKRNDNCKMSSWMTAFTGGGTPNQVAMVMSKGVLGKVSGPRFLKEDMGEQRRRARE